ncbi:MAG: BatD family protein [Bacteroidales bacterium]|nr:BatD family protein [Bacteroidales bacterium]
MKRVIAAFAAILAAVTTLAQNSIKVEVHNIVGLDERFNVMFIIEGEDKPSAFEWTPGDDFQLVWGPQKGSSTSIQIINGKTTKSSQTTYTYILLPKKTGSFQLPPATARVDGKDISSRSFSVEVVENASSQGQPSGRQQGTQAAPQKQPQSSNGDIAAGDLFLRFSVGKGHAVIGEPLNAVLKLYQRVDVAGFEGARFPSFNGFWSQETDAPTNIEFRREQVGDKIYNTAVLRRWVLIPQKAGALTIDPAELVCLVRVRTAPKAGRSIFDSFFEDDFATVRKRITSGACTVNVSPLPAGAPASFGGGVGNFNISATVSKDSLKAHDAASLTVVLSGDGNVTLLEAPKVSFPPDFELYDVKASQKTDRSGTQGSKTFEYPFIPRSGGDFTLAPIKYTYYNVKAGKYVTVQTDSLRLHVEKGSASEAPVQGGSTLQVSDRKGVKTLGEDIRYIHSGKPDLAGDKDMLAGRPLYRILIVLMILAAAAIWAAFRKVAALRSDVAGTRNRKAQKMALKRLRQSESYLRQNLYTAFYEELHKALMGYVSDKLNMDMADQTKENIASALVDRGVDSAMAAEFTALLDNCEEARYSPSTGNDAMSAHYDTAVKVISSIDSMVKTPNGASRKGLSAVALLLSVSFAAKAAAPADSLWYSGISAYTEGRYREAATAWQDLIDQGNVSTDLYYNAGNAWFKTGETGRAILCWERCLKADPSNKDARFNLEFARELTRDRIEPVPEFVLKSGLRKVCYSMGGNTWAVISLLLLALTLSMVLLFLLGRGEGARKGGFFAALVSLLLFAFTLSMALWQRSDFIRHDEAIVLKAVSSVKSSPSQDGSKDLFILHEGTKVKVLDSVGSWINIELSDGREGWIPSADIETI